MFRVRVRVSPRVRLGHRVEMRVRVRCADVPAHQKALRGPVAVRSVGGWGQRVRGRHIG